MRFLTILLLFPICVTSQKIYKGAIFTSDGKNPVPFATVGLIKENTGINADEHGNFELLSYHPQPIDSLIISSVGYITRLIPVSSLGDWGMHIFLKKEINNLPPVSITGKREWRKITLNNFKNCSNDYISSSGYLSQLAQPFSSPAENSLLTKVRICRNAGPIFNPAKARFRIRVYGLDSITGGPGADLCDKVIEVKSKNQSINLNLEEYKIRIPGHRFFIAIEWIRIPYNENKYSTKGSTTPWITYEPQIGWITKNDNQDILWELDYRNSWYKVSKIFKDKTTLISATVKY